MHGFRHFFQQAHLLDIDVDNLMQRVIREAFETSVAIGNGDAHNEMQKVIEKKSTKEGKSNNGKR